MNKTRIIILVSFALVFAAGAAVGLLVARSAQPPRRGSWLAHEFDLTPEQQEQMRKIWSEVMSSARRNGRERRQALRTERDKAVQALLSEEQKVQYEEVMQEYSRKLRGHDQATVRAGKVPGRVMNMEPFSKGVELCLVGRLLPSSSLWGSSAPSGLAAHFLRREDRKFREDRKPRPGARGADGLTRSRCGSEWSIE